MKALQVSKLTKSYDGTRVLKGVSFSLDEGERVALMGPSGSGKSTLLNCVGGIDRADGGEVLVDGCSLGELDEAGLCRLRRETVGTVFQFFHLLPTLSAEENVEFPLQLAGWRIAERRARVRELVDEVGLSHRAHAMPHELSGGEMQRVAIARSLAIRPKLILADEPTGNLDSRTGAAILALLEEVSSRYRIAMVLVTHSRQVTRICRRILQMRDGLIVGEGADTLPHESGPGEITGG